MKLLAFDLSSSVIGVLAAQLEGEKIQKMRSCPIIPPKYDPSVSGFLKTKKKVSTPTGKKLTSYLYPEETTITKAEKEKRDRKVRADKDLFLLDHISKEQSHLITNINPDLILVEKNASFNGMLTTVLLAKVMGSLLGVAGASGAPVQEYPVNQVRKIIPVNDLLREFLKDHTEAEVQQIPDVTKRVIRYYLEDLYGIYGVQFQTDDESDACAVFHYWYETERKGNQ